MAFAHSNSRHLETYFRAQHHNIRNFLLNKNMSSLTHKESLMKKTHFKTHQHYQYHYIKVTTYRNTQLSAIQAKEHLLMKISFSKTFTIFMHILEEQVKLNFYYFYSLLGTNNHN